MGKVCVVFLFLFHILWTSNLVGESADPRLEAFEVKQTNARFLHLDKDSQGNERLFYQIEWDNDSEELHVRTRRGKKFVDTKIGNGVDVGTIDLGNDRKDRPAYLYFHDPKTGQKLRLKITQSPDWPNDQKPESDPQIKRDKNRKLLKLKTDTGQEFFSFCYLPPKKGMKPRKVVVILNGGSGAFTEEVESDRYYSTPTINYLLGHDFVIILANFRGKNVTNQFRLEGVGHLHDRAIDDVVATLDAVAAKTPIQKNKIHVIGHSRGGNLAGLLATRLSERSKKYQITKTIVVDAGMNAVDDYFRQFKGIKPNSTITRDHFDFVDNDWTHGALCFRPKGKFSDNQWEQVQKIEKQYFERYQKKFSIAGPLQRTKSYFEQSPYHHTENLQGHVLLLPDRRRYTYPSAVQFQEKAGRTRVQLAAHEYGHGFDTSDPKAMSFYFEQLRRFFDLPK